MNRRPGNLEAARHQDVVKFRALIADCYKTVEAISRRRRGDVRKELDMARWQRLGRYDEMMGGNINKVWLEVGGEFLTSKRQRQ